MEFVSSIVAMHKIELEPEYVDHFVQRETFFGGAIRTSEQIHLKQYDGSTTGW
jgi:hypothetical protein